MLEKNIELSSDADRAEDDALELGYTQNAYNILYPPTFIVNDFGVQKRKLVDNDKIEHKTIGSRLDIAGLATLEDACEPSLVLKFKNIDEEDKYFILPIEELVAKSSDWARDLVHAGYIVEPQFKKDFAKFFIDTFNIRENKMIRSYIVKQNGWKDSSYILNDEVYGDSRNIIANVPQASSNFNTKGLYAEWKKMATYAEGNAIFEFALAAAFTPVLLKPLSLSNGIVFHLWGQSSCGKSIAQRFAQSVWGSAAQIKTWAGTQNGIEMLMSNANDNLVCLDELSQATSKIVQPLVYLIANGEGKARATKRITLREQKKWNVVVLSSGEQSLEDKMKEIERDPQAGAQMRMPTIPVSQDMLTHLHGFGSGKELVEAVNTLAGKHYGFAGRDFLEHLTANGCKALEGLEDKVKAYEANLLPNNAGSQLARTTKYFALAMAASDLIRDFGIVDFDCKNGVKKLYKSYLEHLSTMGNSEESSIVKNTVSFINKHHLSRFVNYDKVKDGNEKVVNCIGYVKTEHNSPHYYFFRDEFYEEVAKCSNRKLVNKVLIEKKLMILDQDGKNPKKSFGTGRSIRYICINLDNLEDKEASAEEPVDGINTFFQLEARRAKRIDASDFKF